MPTCRWIGGAQGTCPPVAKEGAGNILLHFDALMYRQGQFLTSLDSSLGHLELIGRFEGFCIAMVHSVAFSLSNFWFFRPLVRFLKE